MADVAILVDDVILFGPETGSFGGVFGELGGGFTVYTLVMLLLVRG